MESRGKVNAYCLYKPTAAGFPGGPSYTVNLANGTTPFMSFHDTFERSSSLYRLNRPLEVTIGFAWYRPRREEFVQMDRENKKHILNGGLICKPLAEAVKLQLPDDPVETTWEYEMFQAWALSYYGERLEPMAL